MDGSAFDVEVILPATLSVGPIWIDRRSRRADGAPFSDLPRTTVAASGDQALREVLGRAGPALGVGALNMQRASEQMAKRRLRTVSWGDATSNPKNLDSTTRFESILHFAGFVRPGDEDHGPAIVHDKRLHLRRVAIVDSTGEARWDIPAIDATIADLIRTADADLLDGEPFRPYLIVAVPAGDFGIGADWKAFEDALRIFVEALMVFGGAYSAYEGAKALVGRLRGAIEVIDRRKSQWDDRGGRPEDLEKILGARPRLPREVGALLGCPQGEAEALLWGLGFRSGEDGLWRSDDEPAADALETVRRLPTRASVPSAELVREEAEKAVGRLRDQGEGKASHADP